MKGDMGMKDHYSDYVKKNVSPSQIVFGKIEENDKELFKRIHKQHIRNNIGLVIVLGISFIAVLLFFIGCLFTRLSSVFYDVLTLILSFAALATLFYNLYDVLGPFRGVRKGVVLSSERIQEHKDNRNASYQYVFDIYLPDTDQSLMSYQVSREVFESVDPGDGIVMFKTMRKIKALADPDSRGIMDVSKIKSGVDSKRFGE